MPNHHDFAPGNYRFVPGVFQYSAGVAAQPGYEIVRLRFLEPPPMAEGFARLADHLAAINRPRTAFCACELRSPAPFTETGFRTFNEQYVTILRDWGLVSGEVNPVARSNVCPVLDPPRAPVMFACSYTAPAEHGRPSAVIAGSGEVPEGRASYTEHIVAAGDVSPTGMRRKADYVVAEMRRRLAALGVEKQPVTAVQVYTAEPLRDLLQACLAPAGFVDPGIHWHYARPPIVGLAFEMDVCIVWHERVI